MLCHSVLLNSTPVKDAPGANLDDDAEPPRAVLLQYCVQTHLSRPSSLMVSFWQEPQCGCLMLAESQESPLRMATVAAEGGLGLDEAVDAFGLFSRLEAWISRCDSHLASSISALLQMGLSGTETPKESPGQAHTPVDHPGRLLTKHQSGSNFSLHSSPGVRELRNSLSIPGTLRVDDVSSVTRRHLQLPAHHLLPHCQYWQWDVRPFLKATPEQGVPSAIEGANPDKGDAHHPAEAPRSSIASPRMDDGLLRVELSSLLEAACDGRVSFLELDGSAPVTTFLASSDKSTSMPTSRPKSCVFLRGSAISADAATIVGLAWLSSGAEPKVHFGIVSLTDLAPPSQSDPIIQQLFASKLASATEQRGMGQACSAPISAEGGVTTPSATSRGDSHPPGDAQRNSAQQEKREALLSKFRRRLVACEGPAFAVATYRNLKKGAQPVSTDLEHALDACDELCHLEVELEIALRDPASAAVLASATRSILEANFRQIDMFGNESVIFSTTVSMVRDQLELLPSEHLATRSIRLPLASRAVLPLLATEMAKVFLPKAKIRLHAVDETAAAQRGDIDPIISLVGVRTFSSNTSSAGEPIAGAPTITTASRGNSFTPSAGSTMSRVPSDGEITFPVDASDGFERDKSERTTLVASDKERVERFPFSADFVSAAHGESRSLENANFWLLVTLGPAADPSGAGAPAAAQAGPGDEQVTPAPGGKQTPSSRLTRAPSDVPSVGSTQPAATQAEGAPGTERSHALIKAVVSELPRAQAQLLLDLLEQATANAQRRATQRLLLVNGCCMITSSRV
ncbi:hypothetical protein AB1Y20_014068 [Prymnesium parvum]|uniref:Uncharacterized protein n=1 Tax=Prymnesium parvum TaxID=97485 RepID=A0AB34IGA8_PRYPA